MPPRERDGTVSVTQAGTAAATSLAARGVEVTLLERHPTLAAEASGNAQGVLYAKLSPAAWDIAEGARAVEAGIVLNCESPRELRVIAAQARAQNRRPLVAIRVNPDFELKSSGMKMGGGPKQFGIDAETVPAVLKDRASRQSVATQPRHLTPFCPAHSQPKRLS